MSKKAKRLAPIAIGIVGLALAALCMTGRSGLTPGGALESLYLLLPVIMAGLAVLLVADWYERQRSITATVGQLRQMAQSGAIAAARPAPRTSVAGIIPTLNQVLDRCRGDLERLGQANGQLQVQVRVAAVEKRRVEAILHSITAPVVVTNRYDELTLANAAAERLLGLPVERPARCPMDQALSDARLVALIREARLHGPRQRSRTAEHTLNVDGQERMFEAAFRCIEDGAEDAFGVITVLQDVTREKEIARLKSEFVSTVSHELRAPLAGIKAYIEMLLDGDAPDEATRREFHQIIAQETDRLSRLIDNILNLSRIEAGVVKVVKEPVDLTAIVKEALEVAGPQAAAKSLQLVERLGPVFAQIHADRDMVSQAVTNLISNAIKYTPDAGRITISTRVDEARGVAVLEVEDTGVGIAPEDQPRVFEKFYRVRKNSQMAKGTGLGLSLVRHIVEDVHGGTISLVSQVGKGSTFAVELPLCP